MKKILISEVLLAAFCLIFASATKADTQNIQLGCVSVTCVSNGSILTTQTLTGAQLDLTGNSNAAGELFIAIYVPVSTGGGVGNFIGPNSLEVWSVLEPGVTPGNDHSYGSTLGNDPFANSVTGFVTIKSKHARHRARGLAGLDWPKTDHPLVRIHSKL